MKKYFALLIIVLITFLSNAQNVGIGTTTPTARLHVADSSVVFGAVGIAPVNAGNTPLQGVGRRMMWYADKAAFRTGYASNDEWDRANIGQYSFATGYGVKASGDWSFAAGLNNIAGGQNSIAIGANAQANPNYSIAIGTIVFATGEGATALGFGNSAQGKYSLAIGYNNIAKSLSGTVFGQYNDATDNPNSNISSSLDRIFQIGNGYYDESIDDDVRKNAITVLRNGNIGVGTVTPAAKLHLTNGSAVFTGGSSDLSVPAGDAPVEGSGTRMMWYADKAAFRVGAVSGSRWNTDSIGNYSFATGIDTKAVGEYSTSMGTSTTASGYGSTSLGWGTSANGSFSVSMGYHSNASNDYSTSIGNLATASGYSSISIGTGTTASGEYSTSLGTETIASGYYSTSTGIDTKAKAFGSFTAGMYNDDADNPIPNTSATTDRIFQIGNGTFISKSNAITVLRNGNVGIGTLTPTQKLHVIGNILASGSITPSDARFKKDIEPIHNSLDKIRQINGVTYYYRSTEFKDLGFTDKQQVGVIAQEVEKVLPQLVFTDDKGYKAVDYTKLVPLLIEGIKEQQKQIDELKKAVETLLKK